MKPSLTIEVRVLSPGYSSTGEYVYVAIVVMFHAGYLTTPGIVAVVARHIGVILWPIDKMPIFTG